MAAARAIETLVNGNGCAVLKDIIQRRGPSARPMVPPEEFQLDNIPATCFARLRTYARTLF